MTLFFYTWASKFASDLTWPTYTIKTKYMHHPNRHMTQSLNTSLNILFRCIPAPDLTWPRSFVYEWVQRPRCHASGFFGFGLQVGFFKWTSPAWNYSGVWFGWVSSDLIASTLDITKFSPRIGLRVCIFYRVSFCFVDSWGLSFDFPWLLQHLVLSI